MKRFIFLAVSAVFLTFGVAAFADNATMPAASQTMSPTMSPATSPTNVHQWIGKSTDQLVQQLGKPDITDTTANGTKVYEYFMRQHKGNDPTRELTFQIASSGEITSAASYVL